MSSLPQDPSPWWWCCDSLYTCFSAYFLIKSVPLGTTIVKQDSFADFLIDTSMANQLDAHRASMNASELVDILQWYAASVYNVN